MNPSEQLDLSIEHRKELWQQLMLELESCFEHLHELPVNMAADQETVLAYLGNIDFEHSTKPASAIEFVIQGLKQFQVHTPHPSYFGLFNPAASAMGAAADALAAAYNPQLAAWSHSPFPNEIENRLIREFGRKFFKHEQVDGTFTSGGAEANHTALLAALTNHFPQFQQDGVRAITAKPVLYVSAESHHSFMKAAKLCGLGINSVRIVGVDGSFSMDTEALEEMISSDRESGCIPFFVAATAGTTSSGAIDPILTIASIARQEGLWFHVDAAWGGAACLHPSYANWLDGIDLADSITFDAHKWLSVPMGAGMFITPHIEILHRTFGVETAYMPVKNQQAVINPFHHSIQWSRRFTGLKVFLTLAVAGWDGYREVIGHMVDMGNLLKAKLESSGWHIINDTPLPVVCFAISKHPEMKDFAVLEQICSKVVASGQAWISTTILNENTPVLRACITNYRTDESSLDQLINSLYSCRSDVPIAKLS
jgi:glutamate/tyrosine decarboxylase-like PLP-dependent enzyme